jgi:hypothetical protein
MIERYGFAFRLFDLLSWSDWTLIGPIKGWERGTEFDVGVEVEVDDKASTSTKAAADALKSEFVRENVKLTARSTQKARKHFDIRDPNVIVLFIGQNAVW